MARTECLAGLVDRRPLARARRATDVLRLRYFMIRTGAVTEIPPTFLLMSSPVMTMMITEPVPAHLLPLH